MKFTVKLTAGMLLAATMVSGGATGPPRDLPARLLWRTDLGRTGSKLGAGLYYVPTARLPLAMDRYLGTHPLDGNTCVWWANIVAPGVSHGGRDDVRAFVRLGSDPLDLIGQYDNVDGSGETAMAGRPAQKK